MPPEPEASATVSLGPPMPGGESPAPVTDTVPGEPSVRRERGGLASVVTKLSLVNLVTVFAGLLTGPLQAQALGPTGRGDLAAILVPLGLAPAIFGLGLDSFVSREAARGRSKSELLGSSGTLAVIGGLIGFAVAIPLSSYLAQGRDVVHVMLLIGMLLLPIGLLQQHVFMIALGLERWDLVVIARVAGPVTSALSIAVLYAIGHLTVESAAIVALTTFVVVLIPFGPLIRQIGRPRVDRATIREAVSFGARSWVGTLSATVNGRFDQLLMIRLVSARDLGLYAVAVTVSGLSGVASSALGSGIAPRISRGDMDIARRSLRITIGCLIVFDLVVAAIVPVFLPLAFGQGFEDAKIMTWVLLAAQVPLTAGALLGGALTNAGHPGWPSLAQLCSMVITLPALLLLLGRFGGEGAAWVSLGAYSASFVILLFIAMRRLGGRVRDYVVPTPADARWAVERISGMMPRTRAA